jgi:hypothetical protein
MRAGQVLLEGSVGNANGEEDTTAERVKVDFNVIK